MSLPAIEAKYFFAVLGPALLGLGALRVWGARSNRTQGRIWVLVGLIFCAVAAGLWLR